MVRREINFWHKAVCTMSGPPCWTTAADNRCAAVGVYHAQYLCHTLIHVQIHSKAERAVAACPVALFSYLDASIHPWCLCVASAQEPLAGAGLSDCICTASG